MALISEWMEQCGTKVLDNAGIVREAVLRQSPRELKEYGIFVVGRVIPHNSLIPDSYLSRICPIKPMPVGA
jgi:hypothetical protein